MKIQELIDILNQAKHKKESDVIFYYTNKDGIETEIYLDNIGQFGFITDLTIEFKENKDEE